LLNNERDIRWRAPHWRTAFPVARRLTQFASRQRSENGRARLRLHR
jgi:hypothetical protein